ncbi:MAG: T9SS type A sorting domain-containing protein [bacterium]|nr:T9SS type A sorting domain-containing protein [bacterium]
MKRRRLTCNLDGKARAVGLLTVGLLLILLPQNVCFANDVINVNPDSAGEPWLLGSCFDLTSKQQERLRCSPRLLLLPGDRAVLPIEVDNSTQMFLRPVFAQSHGSCGQASGVGYAFTYEINRLRGLDSSLPDNQYPTHFTYNFLNFGSGNNGSLYLDGWDILTELGCPSLPTYGGLAGHGSRGWAHGYDLYREAMGNRALTSMTIEVDTAEGIETLKAWLHDHADGSAVGGVACFAAGAVVGFYSEAALPAGTPHAGEMVITEWDHRMNHQMTIVGYNDEIRFDFNNDGYYTNDVDLNHDEVIDVRDWEIGGVRFINSWGAGWANGGLAFMPYRLLAMPVAEGGIMESSVHVLRAREDCEPELTMQFTLRHDRRNALKLGIGVASDTLATSPEHMLEATVLCRQGGPYYLRGGGTEGDKTLELGLDLSPLLAHVDPDAPARFFLLVDEHDPFGLSEGELVSLSLFDLKWGESERPPAFGSSLVDNDLSVFSIVRQVDFAPPVIMTNHLPPVLPEVPFSYAMEAVGGTPPYHWYLSRPYSETEGVAPYPAVDQLQLNPHEEFWGVVEHELDFPFPFYGEEYMRISALTDGALLFNPSHVPLYTENSLHAYRAIVPNGSTLHMSPPLDEGLWYEGDENSATFRWRAHRYPCTNETQDFAVKLFPDGVIEFHYSDLMPTATDWVAGISSGDGHNFNIADLSGASDAGLRMLRFTPPYLPSGVALSTDGFLQGQPSVGGPWELTFFLRDADNIGAAKTLPLICATTHVGEQPSTATADMLLRNFPNPFNPNTTITFANPIDGRVTLRVYTPGGALVRTLINEEMAKGERAIVWDGRTDAGAPVAAGIYLYRLTTARGSVSRRMVLLK